MADTLANKRIPSLEELFVKGIQMHHYSNTAYPLSGVRVWQPYRVKRELVDDYVQREWQKVDRLGLYVHIPFCQRRCDFCEYSVVSGEESSQKTEYVDALVKEIRKYRQIMEGDQKSVVGLDIGGGTPTALSAEQLIRLRDEMLEGFTLEASSATSIETTPVIAARNPEKIRALYDSGMERISMGVQTVDQELLAAVGRMHGTHDINRAAVDSIRSAGFEHFNIDIMYGFPGQGDRSWETTLHAVMALDPEYITLYRNRFKGTHLEAERHHVTLTDANRQYSLASSMLNDRGWHANPGKNTFSRIPDDPGTSRYLTERVTRGTPYLGVGLGSQNMAHDAMYLNHGAATKRMDRWMRMIDEDRFPIQDYYDLPMEEMMAKMISVSFYFGHIDKEAFQERFRIALEDKFDDAMRFVQERGYMRHEGHLFALTPEGKDVLPGIHPLFYSDRSKVNLMEYTPRERRRH